MQASPTHGFWNLPTNAAAHGHAVDTHLLLNLWIALALLALAHDPRAGGEVMHDALLGEQRLRRRIDAS